jgi:predicted acyl esterase
MWIATVSDVGPDGKSVELTSGWLMQSRRALNSARTRYAPNGDPVVPYHPFTKASVLPVKPGATDRMAVEIYNTDAVLKPGHRMRVTLSSGDVPHVVGPAGAILNSAGGTSTVHRGRGSQSWLTVPLAPFGPEPAAPAG